MNENQSAHGDREYGHIVSRMRMERKVVVGHWSDPVVQGKLASWMRTAVGVVESSHIRIMRVADNMRNVAVTEGDKVEAQIKFGWEVDAYPVNEIAESVDAVSASDVNALVDEYYEKYNILLEGRDPGEFRKHVAVQAQIELGFERFLEEKNYQAIVTHFGDLGALKQLPGLAIQRLMEKGYGFGAEGDWKVAAMVRLMKIMTAGNKGCQGYFHAGGLYLQSGQGKGGYSGSSYVGNLSYHCGRSDQHQMPASVHGRQRGSRQTGIYFQGGTRHCYIPDRSGQSFPPDHQ